MLIPSFSLIQTTLLHVTPELPPDAWWLSALVLLVLFLAAVVDTFTSVIPDSLMFLGTLAVIATEGVYVSWPFAAHHLAIALVAVFGLWALNQSWYFVFKHPAIGMGDAKWTMLAVSCFELNPALFAWGFGACLAVLWLGVVRLVRYEISRVHFAPFLFIGLAVGLYWLRLR